MCSTRRTMLPIASSAGVTSACRQQQQAVWTLLCHEVALRGSRIGRYKVTVTVVLLISY